MTLTAANVAWAMLWSAVAALAVWFALLPVRRRTLVGVVTSVVLTGTAASMGAMLGAVHAMLLPTSELVTVVVLTVVAGAIGTLAAGAACGAQRNLGLAVRHDRRAIFSVVYAAARAALGLVVMRGRGEAVKDVELLVRRH